MLFERFPGALPSQLAQEDIGLLTRPFQAGSVFRAMVKADRGQEDALTEDDRKLVEPLIKEVRRTAKRKTAETLLKRKR